MTAREHGRGRAVYVGGHSGDLDYGELLTRVVFWAARAEGELPKLAAAPRQVLVYLYPETKTLVVYNTGRERTDATVALDVSLLELPPNGKYAFLDLLRGASVASPTGDQLRAGAPLPIGGHEVRFLRLAPER